MSMLGGMLVGVAGRRLNFFDTARSPWRLQLTPARKALLRALTCSIAEPSPRRSAANRVAMQIAEARLRTCGRTAAAFRLELK